MPEGERRAAANRLLSPRLRGAEAPFRYLGGMATRCCCCCCCCVAVGAAAMRAVAATGDVVPRAAPDGMLLCDATPPCASQSCKVLSFSRSPLLPRQVDGAPATVTFLEKGEGCSALVLLPLAAPVAPRGGDGLRDCEASGAPPDVPTLFRNAMLRRLRVRPQCSQRWLLPALVTLCHSGEGGAQRLLRGPSRRCCVRVASAQ